MAENCWWARRTWFTDTCTIYRKKPRLVKGLVANSFRWCNTNYVCDIPYSTMERFKVTCEPGELIPIQPFPIARVKE